MPAVPASHPQPGSIYQHHNGRVYRVMFITNLSSRSDAHPPDVVYAGRNGHLWSRPLSDWDRSMTLRSRGGA